jgi:hypothetical protein
MGAQGSPRGKYMGSRVGAEPKDEAAHFIKCPPDRLLGPTSAIQGIQFKALQ